MQRAAMAGAGFIGMSWGIVFARAGWEARLFDREAAVRAALPGRLRTGLDELNRQGLCDDPDGAFARITVCASLAEAVDGAVLVQESLPEKLEIKQAVFAELDRLTSPYAVLASSTSAIVASRFTEGLAGRHRCLVGHPVNPPHLIPLVEVCPAPWTDPAVTQTAQQIYSSVGQVPIVVQREVEGFVLNRLQGALLSEALRMVVEGVASAGDVDKAVRDGLGRRWSFMGPFETIELNAPGGIADYAGRYGPFYANLAAEPAAPSVWSPSSVSRVTNDWPDRTAETLDARKNWRDRRLAALAAYLKTTEQFPSTGSE